MTERIEGIGLPAERREQARDLVVALKRRARVLRATLAALRRVDAASVEAAGQREVEVNQRLAAALRTAGLSC